MKILNANDGALSNFEVFDFLRSRGAGKDPTRVIAPVTQYGLKVYDYLEQSVGSQTRESIIEIVEKSKKFNLAKAEILNIINIKPISVVEIDPIIEDTENRLGEELVNELAELVLQVFPPPPSQNESDELAEENKEVPDGQQIEAS